MLKRLSSEEIGLMIKDKTVALVCPSQSVVGSKQKDFIESHDFVVRINRQHPVAENLVEDIGSRTDILYNSNFGDASDNIAQLLTDGYLDDVKAICFPEESKSTASILESLVKHEKEFTAFPWTYQLTFEMMKQAEQWGIKCENQKHDFFVGHTGTIALYHILRCQPKSLYVTGMTFYRDPYYNGYKEDNHTPSSEEKKEIWNKWKKGTNPNKLHNIDIDAEVEFFKKLKTECNLTNDDFMDKILNS